MKKNVIKKSLNNVLLILSVILILLPGCSKEEYNTKQNPENNNLDIKLVDGRLVFKDSLTFMNHLHWISENQGNSELIVAKNKALGFKSMSEYYNEGMQMAESDARFLKYVELYPRTFYKVPFENSTIYELPHSRLVCYTLNKDGIVQIGDKIIRASQNHIIEIKDGDLSKIDKLLLPVDQINDKSILITPSTRDTKNRYGYVKWGFKDKFRIVAKLKENLINGFWYVDAVTIAQKKTLGVYYRANLTTETARNYGEFFTAPNISYDITSASDVDNYESEQNLTWTSVQIDKSLSYCEVFHRARYDGNNYYIYWSDAIDSNPSFTTLSETDDPF